jgi:NAD(P) transhydrogenase
MPHYDYDLVCIGSGPAGQRGAIQAAKARKRVAVVEKKRFVGGICVDTGTIPSKTFREAVRRVYSRPGLEFDDPFSVAAKKKPTMQQLVGHVRRVIQREIEIVDSALRRNDVTLLHGRAEFIDPHTIRLTAEGDRRTITAEKFLIAVGTRPGKPRGIELDGRTVITSDDVLGLDELPQTMAVVGAGVIGIEYASMFAALGVRVTVIDGRERPLEFMDHEIIDELLHQLRKADVTFRCGDAVECVEIVETPRRQGLLQLASSKFLVADRILLSAGREGATEELNLGAVGLEADERGRLGADQNYRTSVENIWAAGDVIGFPALAATSAEQGRLAACHMFGLEANSIGDHFPIGIYAIPELSSVGATEEELTGKRVPYETGVARYTEISRGIILGDDTGMFKMLFHREDGRLLGCHCIGSGATELIHVGQAVLGLGGGLDYFLKTVFNYPTLAECYKTAAFQAANKLALISHAKACIVDSPVLNPGDHGVGD